MAGLGGINSRFTITEQSIAFTNLIKETLRIRILLKVYKVLLSWKEKGAFLSK